MEITLYLVAAMIQLSLHRLIRFKAPKKTKLKTERFYQRWDIYFSSQFKIITKILRKGKKLWN